MVLLQPVGDEIADGADLEAVHPSEVHQVVEARHGAVLAHDLADDAAGVEAREARYIDRGLGMPGADQYAAWPCDQREHMAGRDDRFGSISCIYGHRDGSGAVSRADS